MSKLPLVFCLVQYFSKSSVEILTYLNHSVSAFCVVVLVGYWSISIIYFGLWQFSQVGFLRCVSFNFLNVVSLFCDIIRQQLVDDVITVESSALRAPEIHEVLMFVCILDNTEQCSDITKLSCTPYSGHCSCCY